MSLKFSSVVPAPLDEVFEWHARPGAIARLSPPWPPVRVGSESGSLRDGRAKLIFPGGVKWTAEHRAEGYRPPSQFVDRLATPGLSTVLPWRHTHRFEADGPERTVVTDEVDTPLPAVVLRSMFAYRHRQLAADLAAQHRYRHEPMTVAVTGASGLVGSALTALLTTGGHRVVRLVRREPRTRDERTWRPADPDRDLLAGVDAVVHLAGASIAGRFGERHRRAVRDSRIGPTRALAELAARTPDGPRVFVAASAVGYYGADRGDEVLTEGSAAGRGFLADVVTDWEEAAAAGGDLRVVRVRTGLVLSPRGGVLRLHHPLFAAGLGGPLGEGRQWMPWIGLDDLTDLYLRAVTDERLAGPVNAAGPDPVRNAEYTRTLAAVLRRPAVLKVPYLGPRLLLGETGARELAFADQRVRPQRLLDLRHVFRHRRLDQALAHVLATTTPDTAGEPG
ncbi:TIGR01777 family oxidoreductase [Amycolatopsis sp. PS_44_ISF1]|uniref:TIGR01777 family oxidoreductase n=1 Tax=Amycolatopsis sp. PS_44_ISF1 TaxID=2974917 RepID=UPI0028DDCD3F|nr:TIGR01777 family oxidoreductase [Amycolatopsis sp. PS_44_ISF1]MDT8915165.1 TIGR01777 family oxidoreductase [Amycolatopsis sp. PS_44_ISF1]